MSWANWNVTEQERTDRRDRSVAVRDNYYARLERFGEPNSDLRGGNDVIADAQRRYVAYQNMREMQRLRLELIAEGDYGEPSQPDPDHAPWEGGGE